MDRRIETKKLAIREFRKRAAELAYLRQQVLAEELAPSSVTDPSQLESESAEYGRCVAILEKQIDSLALQARVREP